MSFPECKHFEGTGGRDGLCHKNTKTIQLLKADARACPNVCGSSIGNDGPGPTVKKSKKKKTKKAKA